MGRCLGPCTHHVFGRRYRDIVEQVRLFLDGRNRELRASLKKIWPSRRQSGFERAAPIRDQIRAIAKTVERQHVVSAIGGSGCHRPRPTRGSSQVVNLFVRKGYVVGSRNYVFKEAGGSSSAVIEAFLKQYYSREPLIPSRFSSRRHRRSCAHLGVAWRSCRAKGGDPHTAEGRNTAADDNGVIPMRKIFLPAVQIIPMKTW